MLSSVCCAITTERGRRQQYQSTEEETENKCEDQQILSEAGSSVTKQWQTNFKWLPRGYDSCRT